MKITAVCPLGSPGIEALLERFWSKVAVGDPDKCWEWQASKCAHGKARLRYGRFGVVANGRKRTMTAHRVAYLLTHGEVPDDKFVCHSCDNPPCCNPAHLFPGTGKDNADDRDKKGRYVQGAVPQGEEQHKAKLTEEAVSAMRRIDNPSLATRQRWAEAYGVNLSTIDNALKRNTWKHVA